MPVCTPTHNIGQSFCQPFNQRMDDAFFDALYLGEHFRVVMYDDTLYFRGDAEMNVQVRHNGGDWMSCTAPIFVKGDDGRTHITVHLKDHDMRPAALCSIVVATASVPVKAL